RHFSPDDLPVCAASLRARISLTGAAYPPNLGVDFYLPRLFVQRPLLPQWMRDSPQDPKLNHGSRFALYPNGTPGYPALGGRMHAKTFRSGITVIIAFWCWSVSAWAQGTSAARAFEFPLNFEPNNGQAPPDAKFV